MDVYQLIKARRSVRSYRNTPVAEDLLQRLLEAARWAPSASNRQPWKLVVVRDEERRRRLAAAACEQMFIAQAPIVLAAVALDPQRVFTCDVPGYPIDVAIAVDHVTLAAAAEGLGTCWIAAFDQQRAREILQVPPAQKVVVLLPVGYPADEPAVRRRKPLDALVAYETMS